MKRIGTAVFTLAFCIASTAAVRAAGEPRQTQPRVAVLDFTAPAADADMAVVARNLLEVALYKTGGLEMLERSQVARILKERDFRKELCGEAGCAVAAGRMLSADMIIIGAYLRREDFHVALKCVDIITGKIIAAESVSAKTEKELSPALEDAAERIARRITASFRIARNDTQKDRFALAVYGAFSYPFGGGTSDLEQSYAIGIAGSVYVLTGGMVRPFFLVSGDYSPYRWPPRFGFSDRASLFGLNGGFGVSFNLNKYAAIRIGGTAGAVFTGMKSRLHEEKACNASVSSILELEVTVVRGYFISINGTYTHVFYRGKGINRINAGGGMGYRL